MRKIVVFIALVMISSLSHAAKYWTSPVNVLELSAFYDGHHRIAIKASEPLKKEDGTSITGCALGDSENLVGYWHDDTINPRNRLIYSTALNAYNLASKVKLYLEDDCSSVSGWKMHGIKAIQ